MVEGEQSTNMNLTVRIHDIEYKANIAQGITFSEEYNETLDSGAVRISHIPQIKNLKPYDDVYIYESGDGEDYFDNHIALWRQGGGLHDGDEEGIPFYRHLLVDRFSEDVINLSQGIYSYSIELFSETKGLETIQLPNISVTQPLNISKKIDIYTYLVRFTKLYSPKYKTIARKSNNNNAWTYVQKYTVAPELEAIFGGIYCQDFTLSNPTFRDLLSTLMVTLDMIPYVKDNVIYAKAISERTGSFDMETEKNEGRVSKIVGQMASDDYCDGVRRQYSDALSQDGTCNFVEYLGFRNNNTPLLTLDNMCINTTHKIYRIKKFLMCYYKTGMIINNKTLESRDIYFLCKQDITPLIKLQNEWEMLDQDWRTMNPSNIYELSKYKLGTVSYSIGGNSINGWGTRYQSVQEAEILPVAYDFTHTYIENIIKFVDPMNPYGEYTQQEIKSAYLKNNNIIDWDIDKCTFTANVGIDAIYQPEGLSRIQKLKTIFFEIEYSGFYDGALIHTRDNGNDNIYQNDNVSSSLTLLEKDGFAQKEKLNRFANKTHVINGRLDGKNYSVSKLLKLGNTCKIGNDDDVIIYRREYSIYNNYIIVSYAGIQDYVLKNFYTSVYARYRTNQLMSYGESTNRSETRKVILMLSKDKKFKDENTFFKITDMDKRVESREFFSAFIENNNNADINTAIIISGDNKRFFVDEQTFTSGNMLCFNIEMPDNASGGNYIQEYTSAFRLLYDDPSAEEDYYIGSTQKWYDIVDDLETGAIDNFSFILNNREITPIIAVDKTDNSSLVKELYDYSKNLPKNDITISNIIKNEINISDEVLYKDNKDRINFTIQIEPISDSQDDIVFGDYFIRLSNLAFPYDDGKNETNKLIPTHKTELYYDMLVPFIINGYSTLGGIYTYIKIERDVAQNILNYIYTNGYTDTNNDNPELTKMVPINVSFSFASDDKSFYFNATGIGYENIYYKTGQPVVGTEYNIYLKGVGAKNDMPINNIIFSMIQNYSDYYESYESDVKPSSDYTQNGYINATYIDTLQKINQNMFVQYDTEKYIDKTYIYKILPYDINKDEYFEDKKTSEVFQIVGDGDESKIRVNLENVPKNTKSVNYWYFDFNTAYNKDYTNKEDIIYSYTPEQSGYRFVFGVNVTPEDIARGYIDIYITKTTNRDERVFDNVGRQIGVIHNCIDGNGAYTAPTYQQYDSSDEINSKKRQIRLETEYGRLSGEGVYYAGEIATIEYTTIVHPNAPVKIFYDWYYARHSISKEKRYSFVVGNYGMTIYARIRLDKPVLNVTFNDGSTVKIDITNNNSVETYVSYNCYDKDNNIIGNVSLGKTKIAPNATESFTILMSDVPEGTVKAGIHATVTNDADRNHWGESLDAFIEE